MAESWVEWAVRYQVRRSRQDQLASGEKWAWTESLSVDEGDARGLAEMLIEDPGGNLRNAQLVRKTCEVIE